MKTLYYNNLTIKLNDFMANTDTTFAYWYEMSQYLLDRIEWYFN